MEVIGLDIGTTSTKAVRFNASGQILKSASYGYPLHTPDIMTAEQSPEDIYAAVMQALQEVLIGAEEVAVISFSSAMHSLLLMDESGQPLTALMTWADNRSHVYAERLKDADIDFYSKTGTPLHAMSPLAKLSWLSAEQPELISRANKLIGIKDYIFYRWYGEYVTDMALASATGLFNIHDLQYDQDILNYLKLPLEKLPRVVSTEQWFELPEVLSSFAGFADDAKVVIGASDGAASNIGLGAIYPGDIAVSIGTSGAVRTMVNAPILDAHGRLFCYYAAPGLYIAGGAVNNGAVALQWAKDQLTTESFEEIELRASSAPASSKGLFFQPYLTGERAPFWRSDVRGSFIGLTLHHTKADMLRSVMEGILYNMNMVMMLLSSLLDEEEQVVKATGGFSKSPLWRQMMADIFDRDVVIPESSESACLGAAVIGLVATGHATYQDVTQMIHETYALVPGENRFIYREAMPIFVRLYEHLSSEYQAIADFQSKHRADE